MSACDAYIPEITIANGKSCSAVVFAPGSAGGNCYLKYGVGVVRGDVGFEGAVRSGYGVEGESSGSGAASTLPSEIASLEGTSSIGGSSLSVMGAGGVMVVTTATAAAPTTSVSSLRSTTLVTETFVGSQVAKGMATWTAGGVREWVMVVRGNVTVDVFRSFQWW